MSILEKITDFVISIGLCLDFEDIPQPTFLPGILIRNGGLVIDKTKLLYPGDILHEAGHLAVMPERIRKNMNDNLDMDPIHQGGELATIAWSYAACIHLEIDPHIVFHEHGYKGGGSSIVENFNNGHFLGVPLLVWLDMTWQKDTNGLVFPMMKSWLCHVDKYQ